MCWTTLMTQRWYHYYLFILFVLGKQSSSLLLLVVASLSPLNLSLYILLQLLASWDWFGNNVVKYRPWWISMAGIGLSPMVNFSQYGGISRHNRLVWYGILALWDGPPYTIHNTRQFIMNSCKFNLVGWKYNLQF